MLVRTKLKTQVIDNPDYRGYHLRKQDVEEYVKTIKSDKSFYTMGCIEHDKHVAPIINAEIGEGNCLIGDFLIDTSTEEGEKVARDVEMGNLRGGSLRMDNFPMTRDENPLIGGKILVEGSLVNTPDDPDCNILWYKRLGPDEYNTFGKRKGCKTEKINFFIHIEPFLLFKLKKDCKPSNRFF